MSRPLIRSGQWSQTTTGIFQPAALPNGLAFSKFYTCPTPKMDPLNDSKF